MSADLIQQLPTISLQLNRIVPFFQIAFGTFGNIMNILIFTRRSLRSNPCSLYFLASSINNLFVLYVAALTRLLSSGWKIDPSNTNLVLCRLRIFFVYTSLCLIQWFVVLASVDRYLSSCQSARRRQWSSRPMALKAIVATILLASLAHFHAFIWWSVDYIGSKTYCNIFQYDYEIAFQIFFLLITCILPPILMALFGALTIANVRKLRNQVGPQATANNRNDRLRSKDRQLILMLLVQVLLTVLCTLPFSVANITTMIFQYLVTLSDYGNAVNTFYSNIARIVNYFNPVVGFYIYTLSSRVFRSEIKSILIGTVAVLLNLIGLSKYAPTRQNDQGATMRNGGQQTMTMTKHPEKTAKIQKHDSSSDRA